MKEERKLLALDLDGTVVDSQGVMHQATIDALNQLRARGHIVCYATGRREFDMLHAPYLYDCVDYVILNTGSMIRDIAHQTYLCSQYVDPEAARQLIGACQAQAWQLYVMTPGGYGVNILTEGARAYIQSTRVEPLIYQSAEDFDLHRIEGFMASRDRAPIVSYIARNQLPLECICSEPECYDFTPKGVRKWPAIRYLADHLHIGTEHIIAMGNWTNDLEMVVNAGTGVAAGDAIAALRLAADYVTPRGHNEDAVLDVCRRCFGLAV